MPSELPWEMSPLEVKSWLDAGRPVRLIDVREPSEHALCRISGSELIPMRTIPAALPTLEGEESPLVVFCHHGMRSMQVVAWLREQGVASCTSMAGGIDRWSREVDPAVGRY